MVSAEAFRSRGNPAGYGYFTAIKQIRGGGAGAVNFNENIANREDIKSSIYGLSNSSSILAVSSRAKTKTFIHVFFFFGSFCV